METRPALKPPAITRDPQSGWLWLSSAELSRRGYHDPKEFIEVEVDSHRYELQGFKRSTRQWWVEHVCCLEHDVKQTIDELPVTLGHREPPAA